MPVSGQEVFRKRLGAAVSAVFNGNVTAAAADLGVSQPTLHKILSGKTRESKASTIAHFADRFGVPESWLRGALDTLNPNADAKGFVPESVLLLSRYYARRYREYEDWLEGVQQPQTEEGRRIVKAYRSWARKGSRVESELMRLSVFLPLLRDAAPDKEPSWPREHLDALRTGYAARLTMLRLVVSALQRLGETPRVDVSAAGLKSSRPYEVDQ
jgi:transcriptional regulator with XRE-family HTH domain